MKCQNNYVWSDCSICAAVIGLYVKHFFFSCMMMCLISVMSVLLAVAVCVGVWGGSLCLLLCMSMYSELKVTIWCEEKSKMWLDWLNWAYWAYWLTHTSLTLWVIMLLDKKSDTIWYWHQQVILSDIPINFSDTSCDGLFLSDVRSQWKLPWLPPHVLHPRSLLWGILLHLHPAAQQNLEGDESHKWGLQQGTPCVCVCVMGEVGEDEINITVPFHH